MEERILLLHLNMNLHNNYILMIIKLCSCNSHTDLFSLVFEEAVSYFVSCNGVSLP